MKILFKKIFPSILLGVLISLTAFSVSLAVSATLYGEITDDGGDPNLEVWFQYGKTTSYGYETPHQSKYGPGEFSATVSGLEDCTTYHYRALARHQNYDDTKYGEDKTFTTPCPSVTYPNPTVDLKANGYDGSITIPYNSSATLSWTSSNANYCVASGAWSGTKGTSGSESTGNLTSGPNTYTLICTGPGGSASDTVTIYLQQVSGAVSPSIQKNVRNLSDGQTQYFDSIYADPSEVLEFQVIVNSGSGAQNIVIKDVLPDKVSIRPNSLKIDGVLTSGDIVSGISLGSLTSGQTRTITFLADIAPANQFSFGQTNLPNTATIYWDGNSLSDSATVIVKKAAVAGAATGVPTGFNVFSDYLFLPLTFSSVLIWLFKSHIIEWEEWLDERKGRYQRFRAEKLLKLKTAKIRAKEFLREKLS
jgi:uncharacterized repeat protein (TIGR01451 family)